MQLECCDLDRRNPERCVVPQDGGVTTTAEKHEIDRIHMDIERMVKGEECGMKVPYGSKARILF